MISIGPQVNLDVLSWLLRPVPFVAGLPAPLPAMNSTDNDGDDDASNSSNTPAPRIRDDVGGGIVPVGGASDANGADIVVTKDAQSAEVAPRGDAFGDEEHSSVLGSTPAEEEGRAVPVPVPRFRRAGDDGGGEGTEGSKNRAGFHSYDETHQVCSRACMAWK